MFFLPSGLSQEEVEKLFKLLNNAREQKKKKEQQQKLADYELLLKNAPNTSITSMIGYAHMINYCNPDQILKNKN